MKIQLFTVLAIFSFILPISSIAQDIFQEGDRLFTTEELQAQILNTSKRKITIKSSAQLSGKMEITTESGSAVTAQYFKKSRTDSESNAIDYIDLIAVSIVEKPEEILILFRAPNPAPWSKETESGIVELYLQIPPYSEVEIEARYFDISAVGPFKSFILPASLGRIEVENVNGYLEAGTTNQKLSLKNITGEIKVSTTNGKLVAENIKSPDSQAYFKNDGGDILIRNFEGLLNVRNNYGRISIVEFVAGRGKNFVRGFSAPVIIEIEKMSNTELTVLNRFEDIEILLPENVSASFSLAVEEGNRIEATSFEFKPEFVQKNRLNIVAGKGESSINSTIRGKGNIYIIGVGN